MVVPARRSSQSFLPRRNGIESRGTNFLRSFPKSLLVPSCQEANLLKVLKLPSNSFLPEAMHPLKKQDPSSGNNFLEASLEVFLFPQGFRSYPKKSYTFQSYQKSSKRLLNQARNLEKIHTTKIHLQKWISAGDSHFLVLTRALDCILITFFFPLDFL